MPLARYISPLDLRAVVAHLCAVLRMLAILLTVPCAVALVSREFAYGAVFGGLVVGTYGLGRLGRIFQASDLAFREALVVTALAYPLFAVVGAVPFLSTAPFTESVFEAISGFTTTGLSLLEVEQLPTSLVVFRAYMQWIGGAGIIVLSLAVFEQSGKTAARLYASEFSEDNMVGSVIATARIVLTIYLGLTVIGFGAFVVAGMTPFDALLHVMATVSTGGFSSSAMSLGQYDAVSVLLVVTLFMICGAISFPLLFVARHEGLGRLLKDLQFRYLLGLIFVTTIVVVSVRDWHLHALVAAVFETTSALTTTGFSLSAPASWDESTKLLILYLMIVGGATGSTAGGLKLLRLIVLIRLIGWLILALLLPKEAKLPVKYGELVISDQELRHLVGICIVYMALLMASTFLFVMAGFAAGDAVFESASALSTVGLSAGVTSPQLPMWAKYVLMFDMWAGRLEILPVLVVLYPRTWRRPRRST